MAQHTQHTHLLQQALLVLLLLMYGLLPTAAQACCSSSFGRHTLCQHVLALLLAAPDTALCLAACPAAVIHPAATAGPAAAAHSSPCLRRSS